MNLPLTESQVLIQHYYQKLADRESGRNLDISRAEVKRYLRTGRSHLRKLLQVEPGKGSPDGT
jgi:DNA-directed RNA polymerase specialized sigma24 family protein